jgi:hypothetical protein
MIDLERFGFTPAVRQFVHLKDDERLSPFNTWDFLELIIQE